MYIVSRCLLGEDCKYNGGNNFSRSVKDFLKDKEYCLVCPEVMGGLPVPRPPAEIQKDGTVINTEGADVTSNFVRGAEEAWKEALSAAVSEDNIEGAILKAKSPSCGKGKIYDGTFSGVLTEGDGYFAALLRKKGIKVITEKEIDDGKF